MAPEQLELVDIEADIHIKERFEGLTGEEEYDALLYTTLREREFTPEEIEEIREVNDYTTETMRGHFRKDKVTPTSIHLKRTAIIAAATGGDCFTVKLLFLHDLVEDTKEFVDRGIGRPAVTVEDIQGRYGDQMAKAVDSMSKVKTRYLRGENGHVKQMTIERNILTLTHYKLFESLDDYRVVHAKLCDRYDYFLTPTPNIDNESVKRKAKETLELYVPLADLLRLHFLREELAYVSLRALASKKVDQIETNNAVMFPENNFEDIREHVTGTLQRWNKHKKLEVFITQPSWYVAYREYGEDLNEVDEHSVIAPVINIAIPYDAVAGHRDIKRRVFEKMKPWFAVVRKAYGFPQGSWRKFKEAYIEGDILEIPTVIDGKPVVMRFATVEQFNRALTPVVHKERQTAESSRAHDDFKRLQENFKQLKSIWPASVIQKNTHVGSVVKEIIENIQRPLVRITGHDGKPAIFPRGATVFDAACYFGSDVVQGAADIVVVRNLVSRRLSLSDVLKEGDIIRIEKSDRVNNFLPKHLQHAHTGQARKMLQEGLKMRVKEEFSKPRHDRKVTNQLIQMGVYEMNTLYLESEYLLKPLARKISGKRLLGYFKDPIVTTLLHEIKFKTFDSFMIALTLGRLASKRRQRLVDQIIERLRVLEYSHITSETSI